ncbi:MAG: CHAD domain-containing protein [Proteobacteria bacterium]|nr:CHAD domain-containing protein [Pseudomonadota bacterium]NOG60674.1 CHAD domain-containing protein [Pseudomonadota bacterium]
MKNNKAEDKLLKMQDSVLNTIKSSRQHLLSENNSKEYIHNIRVDIKHLRAWLRLTKRKSGGLDWKKIDRRLSDCAKELGSIRDNQVMITTLDFLYSNSKTKEDQAAIIFIKNQLACNPTKPKNIPEKLKNELLTLLKDFEEKYTDIKSISELKAGFKYSINKCEFLARNVFLNTSSNKDIHKLRKWIKNLYYQTEYISKAFHVSKKLRTRMHKLGNMLGNVHDLIIIKDRLDSLEENYFINVACSLIDENIALIVKSSAPVYKKLFNSPRLKSIF